MQTTYTLDLSNTTQTKPGMVGLSTPLQIPFTYIDRDDIKVLIDGVETNQWEWKGDSSIQLNKDFLNDQLPVEVKIERNTNLNNLPSFNPGSAIRAQDLNAVAQTLKAAIEDLQNP